MSKLFEDLFIFEMANSHQGSVEHGKDIISEMGKIARRYNINAAVKLQYRNLENFIHPDYRGRQDVNHIPRFESTRLVYDQFCELVAAIRQEGMLAMSTPFDEDGVDWCMDQGLDIIKIASCSSLDWPLLEKVAAAHRPIILSVGGKTISDIDKLYNYFTHRKCDFAFMHCIAEYPAPMERLQLDFIDKLRRRYPDHAIGYSGHEDPDDNTIPMMAVAKGAKILERHVGLPTETISLNAYSMNPAQAEKWVVAALNAKEICTMKKETERYISQEEIDSLNSLMRGVYLKHDVEEGQELTRDDVFFAMPNHDRQMTSGEFFEGVVASKAYKAKEELHEKRPITDTNLARSVIHDVKGMLYEANIYLGNDFEAELSHHYGMKHFRQFGAVIIDVINREYCKKLIAVLPGQQHPLHAHKVKEETFQLLYGDLIVEVEGKKVEMHPGDIQTILRGERHAFTSRTGAVFEEISTTHVKNDSYYEDPKIDKMDLMERKTKVYKW